MIRYLKEKHSPGWTCRMPISNLCLCPGKDLGNADALSRLSCSVVPKSAPKPAEVILVMKRMDLSPITSKEIAKETHSDHILSSVYHFVMTGWPEH